jgi:hypothetical protein
MGSYNNALHPKLPSTIRRNSPKQRCVYGKNNPARVRVGIAKKLLRSTNQGEEHMTGPACALKYDMDTGRMIETVMEEL